MCEKSKKGHKVETTMQDDSQGQITKRYQQLHQYYQHGLYEQVTEYASLLCLLIQQRADTGKLATTEIADVLNGIGMIYLFMGKVILAGPPLHQALEIRQRALHPLGGTCGLVGS
jgi:hypothetical protein